jgi:hypothetical protein
MLQLYSLNLNYGQVAETFLRSISWLSNKILYEKSFILFYWQHMGMKGSSAVTLLQICHSKRYIKYFKKAMNFKILVHLSNLFLFCPCQIFMARIGALRHSV